MTNPKYGKELYAWVFDDPTGEKGVAGVFLSGTWFPLVKSDRAFLDDLRPHVEQLVAQCGVPCQLLRFTRDGVVDEVKPKKGSAEPR